MIYKVLKVTAICSLCTAFFATCSLDIPFENQFSDPDAINTPAKARELLATAYDQLPRTDFALSVLGDDFVPTSWITTNAELNNLYKWQPQPIEDMALSLWQDYYAAIAIANAVLERTKGMVVSGEKEQKELQYVIADSKLLKAYCYFYLLRLFAPDYADGPQKDGIILKERVELEFLPRTPIEGCVTAIRNFLQEAVEVAYIPSEVHWLSQTAGYYMLAELELYAHNYEQAAVYAQKVVDAKGGYALLQENVYTSLWGKETCRERIFSIFTATTYYMDIRYDQAQGDYLTVNPELVELYDTIDIRKRASSYLQYAKNGAVIQNCFGKYNQLNWAAKEIQYINKFRLSGACFILAEAYCRDEKVSDVRAVEVMNNYLGQRRAALLDTSLSGNDLLKAILQEKWKEFVGEGERYWDLKRCRRDVLADWNEAAKVGTGKRVQATDYRWTFPIPKAEYLYNEQVSQNEGWPKIEN